MPHRLFILVTVHWPAALFSSSDDLVYVGVAVFEERVWGRHCKDVVEGCGL